MYGSVFEWQEQERRLLERNKRFAEALGIRAALGAGAAVGGAKVRYEGIRVKAVFRTRIHRGAAVLGWWLDSRLRSEMFHSRTHGFRVLVDMCVLEMAGKAHWSRPRAVSGAWACWEHRRRPGWEGALPGKDVLRSSCQVASSSNFVGEIAALCPEGHSRRGATRLHLMGITVGEASKIRNIDREIYRNPDFSCFNLL